MRSSRMSTGVARSVVRGVAGLAFAPVLPVGLQRRLLDTAAGLAPGDAPVTVDSISLRGVTAERVTPTGLPMTSGHLLYLHGGCYTLGSPRSYRGFITRLARQVGVPITVPAYRLAPEHPHPAAFEDALAAYHGLLEQGVLPEHLIVAGDSAGGGLALALAIAIRDDDLPLPAAVAMICPWLDLAVDLTSSRVPSAREPVLTPARLTRWARRYAVGQSGQNSTVSPLHGDLTGLPPLIVHSAADDPLCVDACQLEHRVRAAGGSIDHRNYPDLWHDIHLLAGILPEADDALAQFADSLKMNLPTHDPDVRIGVIGAGASGLCMGMKLRNAGIENFQIYEKAEQVGGTWRDNTYPGLTCDIPSPFYCYSFATNPNWTQAFADGSEVQRYLVDTARRFGLLPHIRFGSEVVSARWLNGRWQLLTANGTTDEVDVLVSATGVLHHPHLPDIEGLHTFSGAAFHSARWDHSVPLEGKRIAVIGNGSSGVQIVTALSKIAGKLLMFQRTAQWIMPAPNRRYTAVGRAVLRRFPNLNRLRYRLNHIGVEIFGHAVVKPGLQRLIISTLCRLNLRLAVRDPELRQRLTPQYRPMCKRIVVSAGFYSAIQKPNVELLTDAIDHIEAGGVRTVDGTLHEVDVIVFATGFDSHAYLRPTQLVGTDDITLDEAWQDGAHAYRTVAVPGFPNFYLLIGPYSPIGSYSYIAIAETQTDYILKWIDKIRSGAVASAVPTHEATARFQAELRGAMPKTVWTTGCDNWYQGPDGTPEVWPWTPGRHRAMLREPVLEDFIIEPGPAIPAGTPDTPVAWPTRQRRRQPTPAEGRPDGSA